MVCMGNICRSPLAEGILLHFIAEKKLALTVDSAGTTNYHVGKAPDLRTMANANEHGIDLSQLKARQFIPADFDLFDKIFVMDKNNFQQVINLARNEADISKVDFLLNLSYPNENREVPDPYYDSEQGFEQVFQLIYKACLKLINS